MWPPREACVGEREKTLLNCRYLSDLRWQIAKTVQVIVEMVVQKHLTVWTQLAGSLCVIGLRVTGGLSVVSKTSASERAVEIPTGECFHSLSMRNKIEWE